MIKTGKEIIVDNFAGGGGASTGIEIATGKSVDIAINHDPAAIAMHKANHPHTTHYCEDVWEVDPATACAGRPVGLAWFSPDCKHHSKAKGGKPVDKNIRGLAWVAVRWAYMVRPRVIMLENVEEFQDWGPLGEDNRPVKERAGEIFAGFVLSLTTGIPENHPAFAEMCEVLHIEEDSDMAKALMRGLGYKLDHRLLRACDYGAPTIRKRFFLIARCDGRPIIWPEPTHAEPYSMEVVAGMKKPWRPVADVIDFSLPCPSIFDTAEEIYEKYGVRAQRPLKERTMARIARGIKKFVLDNPNPFIMQTSEAIIAPSLIQYHDEQGRDDVRGQQMDEPIRTIDASNRYGLVSAFISKYYGGENNAADLNAPAPTVTTRDRMGLVTVYGHDYQIVDIGLRMLTPRELFDANGFPHDYVIDQDAERNACKKSDQIARCGNAVCPPIPTALVRANLPELCVE